MSQHLLNAKFIIFNKESIIFNTDFVIFNTDFIIFNAKFRLMSQHLAARRAPVYRTILSRNSIIYSMKSIIYSINSIIYSVKSIIYSMKSIIYSIKSIIFSRSPSFIVQILAPAPVVALFGVRETLEIAIFQQKIIGISTANHRYFCVCSRGCPASGRICRTF